jgi:septum formation protein
VALVLASASPRRRQLLEWAGVAVEVRPTHIDESHHPGEEPVVYARRMAAEKAAASDAVGPVLAADTVVHLDGRILGKPQDDDEARRFLTALSGRWHAVTTGVCARSDAGTEVTSTTTRVRFRALTEAEIAAYVATGEPRDKAGAYAIQGRGGALVAEVIGSWTNVMGLPVEQALALVRR